MTYPIVRMKFLAKEKLMYGANESAELDDRDLPRYIRITDLDSEGNLKEETFKSLEWEKANPYLLEKGDILFARSGATVGKAYIHETDEPACYAGYLIKLKVDLKRCLPKFVFYYTQTNKYAAWIAENTIQATIQNVSAEKYANLFLPLPSLKTQEIIIKYLENNVAHIDGLIAKKIRYIKLLEQQRQSIITEAVTKGLNPNVKMKDSDVEWIGEIPEHWEVSKLKYHSIRVGDGLHGTPKYDDQGEYYFINGNNLGEISIKLNEKTNKVNEEEFISHGQKIRGNTILISLNGTIGNVSIYNNEKIMLSKSAGYISVRNDIDILFVYHWLKNVYVENYFTQSFAGTTIKNLSLETLRNTPILIMPFKEQQEIANYLKGKIKDTNFIIDDVKNQIDKLKEYRQALIYEVVTGKIDVRELELD